VADHQCACPAQVVALATVCKSDRISEAMWGSMLAGAQRLQVSQRWLAGTQKQPSSEGTTCALQKLLHPWHAPVTGRFTTQRQI